MVLCEICKTNFRCINGEYICEEGHISQTKVEIADDLYFSLRSQKQKTKKEPNVLSKYSTKYKNLLLYKLLFGEMVTFLNCSSTKFIDFYTNFFSGDRDVIDSPIKISLGYLIILGYFTKRCELERKGQLYFYKTYLLEIEKFDHIGKTLHYKNILDMKKVRNQKLGIGKNHVSWINKHKLLDILGTSKYPVNKKHRKILEETSMSHPLIEYNKAIVRQEFDSSDELLLKYFYKVIEIYSIKSNDDLVKYFKKYLELRNLSNKVFCPEDEISMYLYLYNEHRELDIDYKLALKNINIFMDNQYYDEINIEKIEKTKFIDLITLLTHTSHYVFYNRISKIVGFKEFKSTNNIFVVPKTKIIYYRGIKWRSFRIYIRRFKQILSNKNNYKTKKLYIEDDRI